MAGLEQQRAALAQEVTELGQDYERMRQELEPRIAWLQAQADELARQFKPLVAQAAQAYASGQKALAKQLSEQRKSLQAQSEARNAEANVLREELANALRDLRSAEAKLHALNKRAISRKPAAQSTTIQLVGLQRQYGVSEALVYQELGTIAPAILAKVRRIEYVARFQSDGAIGRTISKETDPERAVIYLYPSLSTLDTTKLERRYRDTVVHECGHVLFDRIMNTSRRWEWGNLHNRTLREGGRFVTDYARESLREDFGESFMLYIRHPNALYKRAPERYAFINKVYKELR